MAHYFPKHFCLWISGKQILFQVNTWINLIKQKLFQSCGRLFVAFHSQLHAQTQLKKWLESEMKSALCMRHLSSVTLHFWEPASYTRKAIIDRSISIKFCLRLFFSTPPSHYILWSSKTVGERAARYSPRSNPATITCKIDASTVIYTLLVFFLSDVVERKNLSGGGDVYAMRGDEISARQIILYIHIRERQKTKHKNATQKE